MKDEEMSRIILQLVGGKSNIDGAYHCITRLRLNVKDLTKVNIKKLKEIDGVLTIQVIDNQVQIVIGPEVEHIYTTFCKIAKLEQQAPIDADEDRTINPAKKNNLDNGDEITAIATKNAKKNAKNPITKLLNTLAAIVTPSLNAIIAGGMLKGVSATLTALNLMSANDSFIQILNIVADAPFWFLPFMIGYAAAKRYKVSGYYGLMMAGTLMYPTIVNGSAKTGAGLFFLGMKVPFFNYKASIFPVLLSVWIFSLIFHWINKWMPRKIQIVFTGMLAFLITTPIALIALAPLGNYIAVGLTTAVTMLYAFSAPIAGALFCGFIPLTIIFGIKGWSAVELSNLNILHYDFMLPNFFFSNLAVSGATLAAAYRMKKGSDKSAATSTGLLAILGITEPALYGIDVPYKKPLWASMIGGAIGGCVAASLGVKTFAFAMPGITSIATYVDNGNNLFLTVVAMLVSWVAGFIVEWILTIKDKNND